MTRRMLSLSILLLLALGLMAAPLQAKPASSGLDAEVLRDLAQVRRATAQYQDVQAALDAGYFLPEAMCVQHPEHGGMGYHYLNPAFIAPGDPDPSEPAILVYAPRDDGSLQLVAVEYGSQSADATLFGQGFAPPGGAPFWTLHAWVWKANPNGMFAPFNPNVSC